MSMTDDGRLGYPPPTDDRVFERPYREAGMEPPWLQNWKDGVVVPRGQGGILDYCDARPTRAGSARGRRP